MHTSDFITRQNGVQGPHASTQLTAAHGASLRWLADGYWPVVISPLDHPGPNPGKKPLGGNGWGRERPTEGRLAELFEQHPDAGLGLMLGDPRRCDEAGNPVGDISKWVVDVEVDDPVLAAPVLARLFPGGVPETMGWESNRGGHLLFHGDGRLTAYGSTIIKGELADDGSVKGNADYLGVEIRIGTIDPDRPQQLQTVVPPSPKADGTPRRWNGHKTILALPDSVFADLDLHATPAPKTKASPRKATGAIGNGRPGPTPAPRPERDGSQERGRGDGKPAKSYDRDTVAEAATGDEDGFLALLEELGVRLTGSVNGDGWLECHAVDRDDEEPSAGISPNGVYHDFGTEESISLFDLAARCRPDQYPDWRAAVNRLGDRFVGTNGHALANGHARPHRDDPGPSAEDDDDGLGGPNEAADDPHRLARHYRDQTAHRGIPTLRFWRGDWHKWNGSSYRVVPDSEQKGKLSKAIKEEFDRINVAELAVDGSGERKGKNGPPKCRPVTVNLVANVNAALVSYSLLESSTDQPAWLDGDPPFPLAETLPCRNALVHLPSFVAGKPATRRPTPSLFSSCALDFDFDPVAPAPGEWLRFLESVWPGDSESVETLRQWFGYVLVPDTSQQKILFLNGPTRCGKGTIGRILARLVGPQNAVGPTLASLTTNFGLAPMIGKSLAVVGDVRLSGKADQAPIIERLLSISGEDILTMDRKNREAWSGRLPTRLMLLANEPPRLTDASGALVGRLLVLSMTESFRGREDLALETKLLAELPGILLWAVEGWRSLRERGRFLVPAASRELVAEMGELASPVGAFLADVCEVGDAYRVETKELFERWRSWCVAQGRDYPGDSPGFGRNLRSVLPKLRTTQTRRDNLPVRYYEGLRLRPPA